MRIIISVLLIVFSASCSYDGSKSSARPAEVATQPTPSENQVEGGSTDVGSGGETRASTVAEITEEIHSLKNEVRIAFYKLRNSISKVADSEVRAILEKMFAESITIEALVDDIRLSPYRLSTDAEPCPHQSPDHKDASTLLGKRQSEICFNVKSLTRLPPDALKTQLIALAAHEHAHHFGVNEEGAKRLQEYILGEGKWIVKQNLAQPYLALADLIRSEIEFIIEEDEINDSAICISLGVLIANAHVLNATLYNLLSVGEDFNLKGKLKSYDGMSEVTSLLRSTMKYCTGKGHWTVPAPRPIRPQDREGLKARLREALLEFEPVEKQIQAMLNGE